MPNLPFPLAKQVGRVPSMTLPLDRQQEARFQKLLEEVVMVDLHEHPMVLPEDMGNLVEYLRVGDYDWGYEAAEHGGWAAVATANCFRGMAKNRELSFISFEDLADEVGMMVAHMSQHLYAVVKVTTADEILKAKSRHKVGFMPTVEHMALGDQIQRIDTLYALGVRIAGLTYNLQNNIGSGLTERHDCGLTKFGIDVVHRMNDLGIAVDVSHAGLKTAMDAIEHSKAPILFSHNAAYTLRPTWRTRKDEELTACAKKGGLVAVTAVPNSLSDDPKQNINCVLDHYDYLVKLLGIDHVAIGTDTLIGDHVAYHKLMLPGMLRKYPVPYLDGLESPADGKNLIRGFIARGYNDAQIKRLAGENALRFLRITIG